MKTKFTEVVLLTKSYNLQDFKDWLHWHLDIIGFDCCHIFDNESSVDIKSVCDSYGDRVSYELIKGWVKQHPLMTEYVNNRSRAWWVLCIDDDEFLYMKNFTNVNEMIYHYQEKWKDMNKLSIRWKNMFPKDPLADRGNTSLLEFNTVANERWANFFVGGNKPVKTFVRTTCKIEYSEEKDNQTHNPIAAGKLAYMCNGERLYGNWYEGPDTDNELKILHFQYKSAKEWIWKCRNRLSLFGKRPYIYTRNQEYIVWKLK